MVSTVCLMVVDAVASEMCSTQESLAKTAT